MEWILGSFGLLVGERIVDYVIRRNKTTKELIRKAARAAFDSTVILHGDDKQRAEMLFRNLVETAMMAIHVKPSPERMSVANRIFMELWEARKKDHWDVVMAELSTAGNRGEKIAEALKAGVSPLNPKVKMP